MLFHIDFLAYQQHWQYFCYWDAFFVICVLFTDSVYFCVFSTVVTDCISPVKWIDQGLSEPWSSNISAEEAHKQIMLDSHNSEHIRWSTAEKPSSRTQTLAFLWNLNVHLVVLDTTWISKEINTSHILIRNAQKLKQAEAVQADYYFQLRFLCNRKGW